MLIKDTCLRCPREVRGDARRPRTPAGGARGFPGGTVQLPMGRGLGRGTGPAGSVPVPFASTEEDAAGRGGGQCPEGRQCPLGQPRFSRAPPWSLPRPLSRRTPEHNHSHRVGLLRGPGLSAQPVRVRAKPGTRRHTCTHTRTRAAGQTVCVHPAGRLARRTVTRRRGPPVGDRRGRRASRTACAPGAHAPHAAPSAVR